MTVSASMALRALWRMIIRELNIVFPVTLRAPVLSQLIGIVLNVLNRISHQEVAEVHGLPCSAAMCLELAPHCRLCSSE